MKRYVAAGLSIMAVVVAGCGSSSSSKTAASGGAAKPASTVATGPSGRGAASAVPPVGTPITDPHYLLFLSQQMTVQEHTNPGIGNLIAHCIVGKLQAQGVKTSQQATYAKVQPATQQCVKQILHK